MISNHSYDCILNNIHETIIGFWLAENKCIFHVTQMQIANSMPTVKILSVLTFWDAFLYR